MGFVAGGVTGLTGGYSVPFANSAWDVALPALKHASWDAERASCGS